MRVLGFLFLLLMIAACVRDTDDDEATGPTSAVATTAGGQTSCDDPTASGGIFDLSQSPCAECAYCAVNAKCADETAKCPSIVTGTSDPNIPCDAFRECIAACYDAHDTNPMNGIIDPGEEAAFDQCAGNPDAPMAGTCFGDNTAGADHYVSLLSCIVCSECQLNCDAETACGPP